MYRFLEVVSFVAAGLGAGLGAPALRRWLSSFQLLDNVEGSGMDMIVGFWWL